MTNLSTASNCHKPKGPKYFVCVEGETHPWSDSTITFEEIVELGGWELSQGVIEIDKDNNERTLQPEDVIELKPGQGFSKKICWKRGLTSTEERIEEELALLRSTYPDLVYVADGQWVLIPNYPLITGWSQGCTDVTFQIPATGYPGTPPYGIYASGALRFNGQVPANFKGNAPTKPPFDGAWGLFSWTVEANQWRANVRVTAGANLYNWVQGFAERFREGR